MNEKIDGTGTDETGNGKDHNDITPEMFLDFIRPLMKEPDRQIAEALKSMAELYKKKDLFQAGEQLYRQSLVLLEKEWGSEHPELARTIYNFAGFNLPEDPDEAEAQYLEAIDILDKNPGQQEELLAHALNDLGRLYRLEFRIFDADEPLQRALEIREDVLGENHLDIAQTLIELAEMHRRLGFFNEANDMLERALDIREKALGPNHFEVAQTLDYLGTVAVDQGLFDEAKEYYDKASGIINKIGPDHPDCDVPLDYIHYIYHIYGKEVESDQVR